MWSDGGDAAHAPSANQHVVALGCRCEFLEAHHNRAVSKDTWMQLLDFSRVSAGRSVPAYPRGP